MWKEGNSQFMIVGFKFPEDFRTTAIVINSISDVRSDERLFNWKAKSGEFGEAKTRSEA
jgi:hypothetical protein